MIHLGTQYYRPPFPNARYWDEDLRKMADSGLNTVQLWVVWAWVESKPGTFDFGDYREIVETADRHGLEVVLSTIAAVHPYWIHREVPGSEMVDNFGHKVVSSNRGEIHYGLTPGGCFDHRGIWERMKEFLEAAVNEFRDAPNLFGWDAWNELRWNVQADGLVCYCPETLERFRRWLDDKYGGLEGLNEAWIRRYSAWDEVFPGKVPDRPYTEMMAFQEFISWRSVRHAVDRCAVIKALDPNRPVTVHGGQPTVLHAADTYPNATALHRGNDWSFADEIDGVGCSSFPLWGGREMEPEEFYTRIDYLRSAAGKKRIWLSELQGGRSNIGFTVAPSVDAASQQRWIWTGLSNGADSILFWCWRDEVFGRETTGFGFAGSDGLYAERLEAMRKTGAVTREYGELLEGFRPDSPRVGIYFSPKSVYLYWSQEGTGRRYLDGLRGYARALLRRNIPYAVIEENHLEALDGIDILFMPRAVVTDADQEIRLEAFVRRGGTLFCESETGAFSGNGLFDYQEDRWLTKLTGISETGRRMLAGDSIAVTLDGTGYRLPASQWITPYCPDGEVFGSYGPRELLTERRAGEGTVFLCSTYPGNGYVEHQVPEFEEFLAALVKQAGVPPYCRAVSCGGDGFVHVRKGTSGGRSVVFLFLPPGAESADVWFAPGVFGGTVTDIVSGKRFTLHSKDGGTTGTFSDLTWNLAVLIGE